MNIRQDKAKDSDEELEELIKDHGIDLSIGERSGEELMKKFDIPQGKKLGKNLKLIEDYWLNNNFEISDKELEKIIKN